MPACLPATTTVLHFTFPRFVVCCCWLASPLFVSHKFPHSISIEFQCTGYPALLLLSVPNNSVYCSLTIYLLRDITPQTASSRVSSDEPSLSPCVCLSSYRGRQWGSHKCILCDLVKTILVIIFCFCRPHHALFAESLTISHFYAPMPVGRRWMWRLVH